MKTKPVVFPFVLIALALGFFHALCKAETPQMGDSNNNSAPQAAQWLLTHAPKPNVYLSGMKLELVDFIDCTSFSEQHPFKDDGWSSVASGPSGLKYRETAPTAHSFFSYRFKTAGVNLHHVVVVEYPDDKERVCNLSLMEDWAKVKYNAGDPYPPQEGYYTGDELPLSGKYCYQKLIFWPSMESPALLCLNAHNTMPAAVSRIWVYKVADGPNPPAINEPTESHRFIGSYMEDPRGIKYQYGYTGKSVDNLMAFLKYSGQNLLAFDALIYQWSYCKLDALGGAPKIDMTEKVLDACDKNNIQFVAVFDPTPGVKVKGIPTGDLNDDKAIQAWIAAMKEFVERYGKHPSLKGISFGGPALGGPSNNAPTKREKIGQLYQGINQMLQQKRPDLTLYFFGSNRVLHNAIFNDPGHRVHNDLIAPWESGKASFGEVLADNVKKYYEENHINPADFANRKGLSVLREYYPNDHRLFRFYPHRTTNSMIYRDAAQEQGVTDIFQNGNQNGACLFGTYFEILTPLFAGKNYWWDFSYVAAQINPAEPYFKEAYTNALAQDDVPFILNASWCDPVNGSADLVREFAQTYRTLPAEKFRTVAKENYVVVRELAIKDASYFYILNNHWSAADVVLTMENAGAAVNLVTKELVNVGPQKAGFHLKPYELLTFKNGAANTITETAVTRSPESYAHLKQRLEDFKNRQRRLAANLVPISPRYEEVYKQAKGLFDEGKYEQADRALGNTLSQELLLRVKATVDKPRVMCRRVDHPITLEKDDNEWEIMNTVQFNGMPNLVHGYQMLNLWHGLQDLSGKAILKHDGQNFYIRFFVTDNRLMDKDEIKFQFATDGYESTAEGAAYAKTYTVPAPVSSSTTSGPNYVARKTADGYEGVVTVPLKDLGVKPGGKIGLHINVTDVDLDEALWYKKASEGFGLSWLREKGMEWPPNPYWTSWRDAQSCGEVQIQAEAQPQ